MMIDAKDAVVWVSYPDKLVLVTKVGVEPKRVKPDGEMWSDPIGAHYSQWRDATKGQRVQLLLETVIDLAAQGADLKNILTEFSKIDEFKALGRQSYPMCRALTWAIVGKSLEPNTMDFDDLLKTYGDRSG